MKERARLARRRNASCTCHPDAHVRGIDAMRYYALATDYDGTIATNGLVDPPTVEALQSVLATGRYLILVTGRELPDLQRACEHLELFELVVAENGALLYRPSNKTKMIL